MQHMLRLPAATKDGRQRQRRYVRPKELPLLLSYDLYPTSHMRIASSAMLALFRHQFLFLLAVFNLIIVVHSAATCYLPDGSVANKDDTVYQPCNATAAENGEGSACCDLGSSVCLSTGLCFGSDSYIYRGGCTDRQWSSGNCPSQCLDGMVSFRSSHSHQQTHPLNHHQRPH